MFINIIYKDAPELSTLTLRRSSSSSTEIDMSLEKELLVNPCCSVRVMLEYIRKKCRLGMFTQFDLCDDSGVLMGLFHMPSHADATSRFEDRRTYYLIVLKEAENKRISILPQLNRENQLYLELKIKINAFMSGSPQKVTPAGTVSVASKAGTRSPPQGNARGKGKGKGG